jgi:formylglycine-generating enzyme required for sulfatase activity
MPWEHEQRVLAKHGVTNAEWAVLITAGYYISFPRSCFISHAVWEGNGGVPHGEVVQAAVAEALATCLEKGWVAPTEEGHVERERNVLGEYTGETTTYPKDGVVLTDAGHDIHNQIAIGVYGRDYFAT